MCGSLKLEHEVNGLTIDSRIPVTALQSVSKLESDNYIWTGHCRSDGSRDGSKTMVQQWSDKDHKVVMIKGVKYFTERQGTTGKVVKIPMTGQGIAALVNEKTKKLMIITRAARQNWEQKIHSRMPVTIPSTMTIEQFRGYLNSKLNTNY